MFRFIKAPLYLTILKRFNGSSAYVSLNERERIITLSTTHNNIENKKLQFPVAWLRDNCQCLACYSASSELRNLKMIDFNPQTKVDSVKISENGESMTVAWEDGHHSSYRLQWLRSVAFDADDMCRQRLPLSRNQPLLWCDESLPVFTQPKRVSFDRLMSDDSELLGVLLELEHRGLVLFEGCGVDPGTVKRLCQRLAFPRTTHYGETFEMKTEAKPRNLGYTPDRLDYHTDLPYLHEQPGVQVLHCLRQAQDPGGDSLFADGFSAAERIRRNLPNKFRLLTSVPVRFCDRGQLEERRFDLVAAHPTVELEYRPNGEWQYSRVHFSNQQRDRLQAWPLADVQDIYDALKTFNDVIEGRGDVGISSDGVRLQVKLQAGEMALFDNSRLLHSRTGFQGVRHLAGAYLLWDEVLSRRRTLESQLHSSQENKLTNTRTL